MDREANLFVSAVGSFLKDCKDDRLKDLTESDLKKLYIRSFNYDVIPVVFSALLKNGVNLPEEISAKFNEGYLQALSRYENAVYELSRIGEAFCRANVNYIPLKGAVIRKFYREPFMRTSADIDVLIKKEDVASAEEIVKKVLKYKYSGGNDHDRAYKTASGICLELHFDLIEENIDPASADILSGVWGSAVNKGGCEYAMPQELFFFYHVAHMAKHFKGGTLGFRPFMDLWLLNNSSFRTGAFFSLLNAGGLKGFYDCAKKVCDAWFNGGACDEDTLKMQEYVLSGGAFGNAELKASVDKKNKGGTKNYFKSRIFLPYSKLKNYYPSLEKAKWLLPVYEIRRWLSFVFLRDKRKLAAKEIKKGKTVTEEKGENLLLFCKKLGL